MLSLHNLACYISYADRTVFNENIDAHNADEAECQWEKVKKNKLGIRIGGEKKKPGVEVEK